VKRFNCFSKSQPESAVYAKRCLSCCQSNFYKQTGMITKFNATLCPLRQVLPLLELQNLLIVESLHFAMFTSPGHKHKHYDDFTHTSSHPLFACQSSSWRRNYDRYCSFSSRWLSAQTADSNCDWLKQLKRFTDGAFFG